MYNGIGLRTARGSGTNGYVQKSLAHVRKDRNLTYFAAQEQEKKRAEQQKGTRLLKKADPSLLEHERKRQVLVRVLEFEAQLKKEGRDEEEVKKRLADYQKDLMKRLEDGTFKTSTK